MLLRRQAHGFRQVWQNQNISALQLPRSHILQPAQRLLKLPLQNSQHRTHQFPPPLLTSEQDEHLSLSRIVVWRTTQQRQRQRPPPRVNKRLLRPKLRCSVTCGIQFCPWEALADHAQGVQTGSQDNSAPAEAMMQPADAPAGVPQDVAPSHPGDAPAAVPPDAPPRGDEAEAHDQVSLSGCLRGVSSTLS